jgi:hypothetical protein
LIYVPGYNQEQEDPERRQSLLKVDEFVIYSSSSARLVIESGQKNLYIRSITLPAVDVQSAYP